MKNNTNHLPLHEWCIVILFCTVLLLLAGFALARSKPEPILEKYQIQEKTVPDNTLQITITGQVAKPGTFLFPINAKLKQIFEEVQPLPTADLSHVNYRKKLRNGQKIIVPERKLILITISGAVEEPGPMEILSGSRCCELVNDLKPLPEADLKGLRKRKGFIKEGDYLEVPYQKVKKKKKKPKKREITN